MQKTRREVRNFIGGDWVDGDGRETRRKKRRVEPNDYWEALVPLFE